MFKIRLKHLYFLYLQFMDIPLVTYINTKKKFGKKSNSPSNSPRLSTPIMSSSPKTIPTPRTYATVIAPTNVSTSELTKTPVMEYPPLPTHYIRQPIKQYELFPMKADVPKEHSFRENCYITQQPIKQYELFPMKADVPKERYPFRENYYNIPPNPPYIQQMLYTETYPPQNYAPSPQNYEPPIPPQNYPPRPPQNYPPPIPPQNYPPPPPQNYSPLQHYMNMKTLATMHYHENFWNRFCKNDSVRVNVRESFKYFPH